MEKDKFIYWNDAMFKDECSKCHRTIYPGETIVTKYFDRDHKNISVLEAGKMSARDFSFEHYCSTCEPFIISNIPKTKI